MAIFDIPTLQIVVILALVSDIIFAAVYQPTKVMNVAGWAVALMFFILAILR